MGSQDQHEEGDEPSRYGHGPLVEQIIDGMMLTISKRFDLVFARPDIRELLDGFIAGDIGFLITKDAIVLGSLSDLPQKGWTERS